MGVALLKEEPDGSVKFCCSKDVDGVRGDIGNDAAVLDQTASSAIAR
jgi:hypothetical protein